MTRRTKITLAAAACRLTLVAIAAFAGPRIYRNLIVGPAAETPQITLDTTAPLPSATAEPETTSPDALPPAQSAALRLRNQHDFSSNLRETLERMRSEFSSECALFVSSASSQANIGVKIFTKPYRVRKMMPQFALYTDLRWLAEARTDTRRHPTRHAPRPAAKPNCPV